MLTIKIHVLGLVLSLALAIALFYPQVKSGFTDILHIAVIGLCTLVANQVYFAVAYRNRGKKDNKQNQGNQNQQPKEAKK